MGVAEGKRPVLVIICELPSCAFPVLTLLSGCVVLVLPSPQEGTPGSPAVLIKFAAHLALFLRQVRGACPHADHLIEAYVRHLIKTKQTALVALYTCVPFPILSLLRFATIQTSKPQF